MSDELPKVDWMQVASASGETPAGIAIERAGEAQQQAAQALVDVLRELQAELRRIKEDDDV